MITALSPIAVSSMQSLLLPSQPSPPPHALDHFIASYRLWNGLKVPCLRQSSLHGVEAMELRTSSMRRLLSYEFSYSDTEQLRTVGQEPLDRSIVTIQFKPHILVSARSTIVSIFRQTTYILRYALEYTTKRKSIRGMILVWRSFEASILPCSF